MGRGWGRDRDGVEKSETLKRARVEERDGKDRISGEEEG
jgi:hypothetical protein